MDAVKIGDKIIGNGEPCFIIAEAGINHNGDINIAKELIDVAAETGADAVKFQSFSMERFLSKKSLNPPYEEREESTFDLLKRLELSYSEHEELFQHCEKREILFISTPLDFGSADMLDDLIDIANINKHRTQKYETNKELIETLKKETTIIANEVINHD